MIRMIPVATVQQTVRRAIEQSVVELPADYLAALEEARQRELSPVGQSILLTLTDNAAYASSQGVATCQDTGMAVIWLEVGQDVHFSGGHLADALEEAVRQAFGPLRKSMVADPLDRKNTGDNTPPLIHYELVPGDQVRVTVMLKGFGAELMSRLAMLTPADGLEGVRSFVLDTVAHAGPNACPPVIVGVGLGSTFDGVAHLAKRALLRPLGQANPQPHLAQLERELLDEINDLGIGPQGLGGTVTALAVHVESYATHIAAIPVAVNLNCSAPRRITITI